MIIKLRLIDNRCFRLVEYDFSKLNEQTKKMINKDLKNFAIFIFNLVNILGPKTIALECTDEDIQNYFIKSLNRILETDFSLIKLGGKIRLVKSLPFYTEEPISLRSKVKALGQFEDKLGIGVFIGANTVRAVCIDGYGNIIKHAEMKTYREEGYQAVIDQVQAILEKEILEIIRREAILSVGIGIPGVIDPLFVKQMIIMEDWEDFNLKDEIERRIDIPTFIENDANAIAIGEKEISRIQGDFFIITLGENVGGGLIVNDRIVHGENYLAGELGHIIIDNKENAPICGCGNKGCLEAYISNLFKNFTGLTPDFLNETAKLVTKAIQIVVNITKINQVFIGSDITKFGYQFHQTIQDNLRIYFPPESSDPVRIYESCMVRLPEPNSKFVGAIGAAIMGMQKISEVSEKAIVVIKENDKEMGRAAAQIIADQIRRKPNTVLGLATGSTPISTYRELVRMHKEEDLDFSQVVAFNLDEYYPIKRNNLQSYHRFMHYWLFNHVNIGPKNIYIPNGEIEKDQISNECVNFEEAIRNAGGIDIQILGIGGSYFDETGNILGGHIGFNEVNSDFSSRTREVTLAEKTRIDNARFFKGIEEVPKFAITMGIGTILEARRILLLASGEHKAQIVKEAIEKKITPLVPASALQTHSNTTFLIEKRAASTLSRITYPWLFFDINWEEIDEINIDRAIIWLSIEANKPIDQLDLQDFHNNFLSGLAKTKGYKVSDLTKAVINRINNKIFYKEKFPRHKKILVISARPGDDAIIGDIIRSCVRNENNIKIVNMVSGNINVKNSDVIDYCSQNNIDVSLETITQTDLLQLKTLVRKAEAIELHSYLGITSENLYFLNLPFYEVKNIEERVITDKDIDPLVDILNVELPDIIISPEGITDPHGLKENVVEIFNSALKRSSIKNVEIWQYKTVMEDFFIPEGDIIFPFNEQDMDLKIAGIKRLRSQDTPILPGYDPRSLWYRIKERNQRVGDVLTTIGLVSNEYRYVTIIKVHHFEQ